MDLNENNNIKFAFILNRDNMYIIKYSVAPFDIVGVSYIMYMFIVHIYTIYVVYIVYAENQLLISIIALAHYYNTQLLESNHFFFYIPEDRSPPRH